MATQDPDHTEIVFLKQTLLENLKKIAEGDIDQLSVDVLRTCLSLLKEELAKVSPMIETKPKHTPQPPPPPAKPFIPKAATPIVKNTTERAVEPPTPNHGQALREKLKAIQDALALSIDSSLQINDSNMKQDVTIPHNEETNSPARFLPLRESRVAGIQHAETNRMKYLQQLATERANPEDCTTITDPFLAEVFNLRKALKPPAPLPKLTELEIALLREKNTAAYNARMEEKQKLELAKEIKEILESFVMIEFDDVDQNTTQHLQM